MPNNEDDDSADELAYARGRLPTRTYLSKGFKSKDFIDDGLPARFIHKVFDDKIGSELELCGEDYLVRETPGGRYQFRLLIAREAGNIKEIWIQKVPGTGHGKKLTTLMHLVQPEVSRLLALLKFAETCPVEGGHETHLDENLLRELSIDSESIGQLYKLAPQAFREIIKNDGYRSDVLALEHRRREIKRFQRLLKDDDFFEEQKRCVSANGDEIVWQQLFEKNPWMLGVSLTGQLLTRWDSKRLEQVVAGTSIHSVGKRVDAMLHTSGRIKSMVFAEIKTPKTDLIKKEYRSGCWAISQELAGAVAQVQGTTHRFVTEVGERFQSKNEDGTDIAGDFTYLFRPRSFLVVGDLSQLQGSGGGENQDKVRSFELFRRQITEPEILTFDEVLSRAEWALELTEAGESDIRG